VFPELGIATVCHRSGNHALSRRNFGDVRFLRVVVLAWPTLGGLQLWVTLLQARALRADFRDKLLHQLSVRANVLAALLLRLAFIGKRDEDPFGNLPRSQLLIRPFLQVTKYGLRQI
jgi:hypothetical protein